MPRPGNPLNMLGVFNPLDYGGVGDGVTDDSVPLFLAVYAASLQPGGGTVLIDVPYKVSSRNIVVPGTVGCWYVGPGAVTTGGAGGWSGNIANVAVSQIGNGGGSVTVNADGSVSLSPATGKDLIIQGGTSGAPIAIGNAAYQADSGGWGRVLSVDAAGANNDAFNVVASNNANPGDAARGDFVVMLGHNVTQGGGTVNAAHAASWISMEQYYNPAGTSFMESHWVFQAPGSVNQRRWITAQYTIGTDLVNNININAEKLTIANTSGGTVNFQFNTNALEIKTGAFLRSNANNQLFLTQLNAAGSLYIELLRLDATNVVSINAPANAAGIKLCAPSVGFYNTAPATKQTVSGSKGANAALTSLMAALVAMGLVTDTTT